MDYETLRQGREGNAEEFRWKGREGGSSSIVSWLLPFGSYFEQICFPISSGICHHDCQRSPCISNLFLSSTPEQGVSNESHSPTPLQCYSPCLPLKVSRESAGLMESMFGYRYTSSKGLVSEKQLSQTSFTTLAAWTSSLHSGLFATEITALRLMHS